MIDLQSKLIIIKFSTSLTLIEYTLIEYTLIEYTLIEYTLI